VPLGEEPPSSIPNSMLFLASICCMLAAVCGRGRFGAFGGVRTGCAKMRLCCGMDGIIQFEWLLIGLAFTVRTCTSCLAFSLFLQNLLFQLSGACLVLLFASPLQ